MSYVWLVIAGAILGVLARLLLRGRQEIPWWATIGAGIVGVLVGNWLASLLGVQHTNGIDWIRHGLQLVVGVVAVGGTAALFASRRAKTT